MQENLQSTANQERLKQAIENKSENPEKLALDMLRQGDTQVTDILSWIADHEDEAMTRGDFMTAEELGDIKKAVNEAYAKLRRGLEQAKNQPLAKTEEAELEWELPPTEGNKRPEMSAEDFNENLEALFNQPNFDFESFDSLLAAAESAAENKQNVYDSLSSRIADKYAKRLMEDEGFRAELSDLATSLAERAGEDGPELLAERSIGNLIVVHEMFGKEAAAVAKKMDLNAYEPGLSRQERQTVISVSLASFDYETGELADSAIEVGYSFDYVSPTGENEDGEILRKFSRSVSTGEDGVRRTKKKVHHELLRVPQSLQGNSTAARVTNECLPSYDATGIEEITLNASLEKGGYTWAAYGYGWDEEKTGLTAYQDEVDKQTTMDFEERSEELKKKIRLENPNLTDQQLKNTLGTIKLGEVASARRRAATEFAGLPSEKKQELTLKRIYKMVKDSRASFLDAAVEAGVSQAEIDAVNEEYNKLLQNPETTTPQKLATVGRDNGPRLRIGEAGTWRTEKAFEETVGRGEDSEVPQMKGSFHAGKIGLMSSNWYGKIELKPQGKQQGKNREALQKVLDKSIKKYDDKKRQAA